MPHGRHGAYADERPVTPRYPSTPRWRPFNLGEQRRSEGPKPPGTVGHCYAGDLAGIAARYPAKQLAPRRPQFLGEATWGVARSNHHVCAGIELGEHTRNLHRVVRPVGVYLDRLGVAGTDCCGEAVQVRPT